jgi:RNA polymerase sigma-70 factor (ECF subfamily)
VTPLGSPAPPDPLDEIVRHEDNRLAALVVLDNLTPAQRVAFVLHDVFDLPFDQIGPLLDRSPDAAKKLASRARARLHAAPAERPALRAEHLRIVDAFLSASRGGDIPALMQLLAPDVVRRADPVLLPDGVAVEIRGAAEVATETRRFTERTRAGAVLLIDGAPGIAIAPGDRLVALLRVEIGADGRIHALNIAGGAERLRAATLELPDPGLDSKYT